MLKDDFKAGQFKPAYLLHGEEPYLIRHFADRFLSLLDGADPLMNQDTFEGKDFDTAALINAANTLPFFSAYRLVFVKDSGLFAPGRKDATDEVAAYLPQLPPSTVLVFCEDAPDKRNRLFKAIAQAGGAEECNIPSENELVRWLTNVFKKKGKSIAPETARLMLATIPKGMDAAYKEADKLGGFLGDRTHVTDEDIHTMCTKSLESRIFALVGALCNGQVEKALVQYRQMLVLKEQPLMVLTMIARQFRMVLQCQACAATGMNPRQIADSLRLRDFMVRESLAQARHFSAETLTAALRQCQDIDTRVKTGLLDGELGVELLIVQYGKR